MRRLPVLAMAMGVGCVAVLLGGVATVASGITSSTSTAGRAVLAPEVAVIGTFGPPATPTTMAGASSSSAPSAAAAPSSAGAPPSGAATLRPSPSPSPAPTLAGSPGVTLAPEPPTAPASASPSRTPAATTSARSAGRHPTPKASATPSTNGSGPSAKAAAAGAAPGNYAENVTGTVSYAGMSTDASGTATLTVDPASGPDQTQTVTGGNSTTVEKLVFGAAGVDATELSITSQVLDADFVLSPQEPIATLSPGATWSWKADSTDGKEHLALTGAYAGIETVTINGQPVTTDIIKSTLTLTGSVATTITQTDDYSETYHLDVREHQVIKGAYRGVNYTSDATSTIGSLTPS